MQAIRESHVNGIALDDIVPRCAELSRIEFGPLSPRVVGLIAAALGQGGADHESRDTGRASIERTGGTKAAATHVTAAADATRQISVLPSRVYLFALGVWG